MGGPPGIRHGLDVSGLQGKGILTFFLDPPSLSQAAFLLGAGGSLAAVISGWPDAHWATPLNTILLIVLSVIARQNGKKIKQVRKDVSHAADAAASAANAAADAARIAREVGANRRGQKQLPPPNGIERRKPAKKPPAKASE